MGPWPNPLSPREVATSACFFVAGVFFFSVGAYLSFLNVAPQQARTKARDDYIRERLRKLRED